MLQSSLFWDVPLSYALFCCYVQCYVAIIHCHAAMIFILQCSIVICTVLLLCAMLCCNSTLLCWMIFILQCSIVKCAVLLLCCSIPWQCCCFPYLSCCSDLLACCNVPCAAMFYCCVAIYYMLLVLLHPGYTCRLVKAHSPACRLVSGSVTGR